jgi:cytochrome P450/ferredoxin-NADP reductase
MQSRNSTPIPQPDLSPTGCPMSRRSQDFDAFGDDFRLDPAETLRWSRVEEPVFFNPRLGYWIVSRYEDVKAVFRDNILFSPSIVLEKITPSPPEAAEILNRYDYAMNRTLVNEDEPAHTERRRLLMEDFLPERLEHHAPMIRKLTNDHIDAFIDKGRANLVTEMFWEIPQVVALQFLGVSEEDIGDLKSFSVAHVVNTWGRPAPEEQLAVAEGVGKFWQASGRILEKMKLDPDAPGWMQSSIRQYLKHPEIVTHSYLHSMMMAILVAAHETTANASANAFRLLLSQPDIWQEIVENPALIPNAVEQCLRHSGPIAGWRRMATADTEIGGVKIPKGAKLLIAVASANHDERHFENPDALDLYRNNSTDHLNFGYGSHQCMGKNIGRMEMRIFLDEMTRRLPHLRLAEQEFEFPANISFRGPKALWVEWNPALNPERVAPNQMRAPRDFPVGPPEKASIMRDLQVAQALVQSGILHLTLKDPHGRDLPQWRPGSHIDLAADGFSRKYSLCGDPTDRSTWQVAILNEPDGRGGSAHFHATLRPGSKVRAAGPFNLFQLDETADSYLLIAGGIGITPILAMADRLKARNKPYSLIYCGKNQAEMPLMARVMKDHADRLTIYARDRGQRANLKALTTDLPEGRKIYACGPTRLLDELEALSGAWSDGTFNCEHFNTTNAILNPENEHAFKVVLKDSGLELDVRADQTLLEVLNSAGIDINCDCREGLCGSCEAEVIDGEVDHRDRVLSRPEREAGKRMMTCCSRAVGEKITLAL